jgi:hypothetical protein
MAAGEAVMAISLANSLFFSIRPGEARGKVLLFLALSMAPFAVIAPLIGPAIDRMPGGRRLVVQIVAVGRCLVALLMVLYLDSLLLFPLAFAALVLSKTYAVSKSALMSRPQQCLPVVLRPIASDCSAAGSFARRLMRLTPARSTSPGRNTKSGRQCGNRTLDVLRSSPDGCVILDELA